MLIAGLLAQMQTLEALEGLGLKLFLDVFWHSFCVSV